MLVDNVGDRDEQQPERERTPLLATNNRRYRTTLCVNRCCIRSKSALLILCWETLITLTFGFAYKFGSVFATDYPYLQINGHGQFQTYAPLFFGVLAISYLFYPLAGCLADVRCGRYKTLLCSLWFIILSGVFTCIGSVIISLYAYYILPLKTGSIVAFAVGFGPPTAIGLTLLLFSSIVFNANIIQYGMDQLHDSPTEDSVLFIHWFAFSSHLGVAINKLAVPILLRYADRRQYRPEILNIVKLHFIPIVAFLLLGVSLAITYYKRQWFMIDTGSRNPYKLVYKVIKFAAQHKIPIHCSSFTYCEEELPSRMDLAKEKYGGPFTTEQVEDVKIFFGILGILITFGSVFITDIAASNILFKLSLHLRVNNTFQEKWYHELFETYLIGGLSEILIIIFIPVYLCVLRPFIHRYIPGMLKRIGLGITIRLLSLVSVFLIDTVGHIHSSMDHRCFIRQTSSESLDVKIWYVTIPYTLNALSDMLFYIAAYEFICAQSPQAMKGLFIGTFFTIKGVFQLISVLVILIPFTVWKFETSIPSCGFVYYLVNIAVAVIGLVAYTWVSRRYQYRQRDEPDNIYRYAEEYYDRGQDQLENYDDYDDLN